MCNRSALEPLFSRVSDAQSIKIEPAVVYIFLPSCNGPPIRGQEMKWRLDGAGSGAICTGMQPLLFANVHIFLWIMYAMPSSHPCSHQVCYF